MRRGRNRLFIAALSVTHARHAVCAMRLTCVDFSVSRFTIFGMKTALSGLQVCMMIVVSKNERAGMKVSRARRRPSPAEYQQYITNGGRTLHARRRPSPAEYILNGGRKQVEP